MTTVMMAEVNAAGGRDAAAVVLGYLNFSSGAFDPAAWRALDSLFAELEPVTADGVAERPDTAAAVAASLGRRLDALAAGSAAFRDATQARAALRLVFDRGLPAYRRFHADLLEHQPPGGIERPWFVMAAAQAVLAEIAAGDGLEDEPLVARAIDRLDDYVGWRPVAVLENGRLSAPYSHERVRPVPLFIAGAGAAHGRYGDLVGTAVEILATAPADLLRQADFDPEALEELAIDPRAFDFLHPAASRPNYLFGLWDPGRIDGQGRYRRMVVQQATLDGILSWPAAAPAEAADPDRGAELRREAAAVLAGVVLMAAGLSGHGPGARQAALPLAELLPRIAGYRDEFYRWMLGTLPPRHRARLEDEAVRRRQPFGGVRRHINAVLAGRRARQVENVALAAVCARLGRPAAADRLAGAVPAASARLFARLTSRVVAAQGLLRRGPEAATAAVAELDAAADLLFRAVECGAAVDPWNILGLSAQFPLHEPGGESLPDPRVDDLVHAVDSILSGYAAVRRQAALAGARDAAARAAGGLERLGSWWDRFATTTVSGVPHLSGREVAASAAEVIAALERRRESAPAPPPLGFWRREVASFTTPRSHAQAAEELLREGDIDGAMGLLVHWASLLEGDAIGRTGPVWLAAATRWLDLAAAASGPEARARVRRFLELVEANTSAVVDVVEAAAAGGGPTRDGDREAGEDDDQADGTERLAAAYESMVWRDSADDGVDGGMIDVDLPDGAQAGDLGALEDAAELLAGTLGLLRSAVTAWCAADAAAGTSPDRAEIDSVIGWRHSLRRLRRALVRAATVVAARDQEPPPGMQPAEFDRLRWQRDAAAERLVDAAVQAGETSWILAARLHVGRPPRPAGRDPGRGAVGRLFAALFTGDAAAAARALDLVRGRLSGQPVLYVPLARGGRPARVVQARGRERLLTRLAACLPRVGLVAESIAIVQLAKSLESLRPAGGASVSEFDRVFEAATAALVERIVESAGSGGADSATVTQRILDGLALLVPRLLETWLTHARQLRLSVLERVRDDRAFAVTREFVEHYGAGLFTQHLLAPSSLRGILRGGVRTWLERLVERAGDEPGEPVEASAPEAAARRPERLVEDLASGALGFRPAAARLRLVLEAVAENHAEYRDWNSTTTQSDRGECLHILLDFLRVKAEYDRIAWTLRPVNVAHRVLARRGAAEAAEAWRGRMRDETRDTAAALVERLAGLEAHWGTRLASVGDRVRRSFTAALEQDELEALVEPAVRELVSGEPDAAGGRLEARAESFLGVASGSGVEVPEWLERLSAAVDRSLDRAAAGAFDPGALPDRGRLPHAIPWVALPWESLLAALER
ncbi:MAG: hypothetical protein ACKOSQ_04535 [Planctomycetaceae bacterium]